MTATLAVLSPTFAPDVNGQALALERVLGSFPQPALRYRSAPSPPGATPSPTAAVEQLRRGWPTLPWPVRSLGALGARARDLVRLLRRDRPLRLLACSGDLYDLPAAALAARWTGTPLSLYFFDRYSEQFAARPLRAEAARWLEPWVVAQADCVVVPNEFLERAVRLRYPGAATVLVRNPAGFEPAPAPLPARSNRPARLLYTGSVYLAQGSAFQALGEALAGRDDFLLRVACPSENYEEARRLLRGFPAEVVPGLEGAAIRAEQREADVLYLPLAFDSPYPDLIRTSSPGKLGEYLGAGRPLLVHAPEDSFVSWFARERGCGLVAGRSEQLSRALDILAEGGSELEQLVRSALGAAAEFDAQRASRTLWEQLVD